MSKFYPPASLTKTIFNANDFINNDPFLAASGGYVESDAVLTNFKGEMDIAENLEFTSAIPSNRYILNAQNIRFCNNSGTANALNINCLTDTCYYDQGATTAGKHLFTCLDVSGTKTTTMTLSVTASTIGTAIGTLNLQGTTINFANCGSIQLASTNGTVCLGNGNPLTSVSANSVYVGNTSGYGCVSERNVSIGTLALFQGNTASSSVVIGFVAGRNYNSAAQTAITGCVLIGSECACQSTLTTSTNTVAIGFQSANSLTSGSNCLLLGAYAGNATSAVTVTSQNNISVFGDNNMTSHNFSLAATGEIAVSNGCTILNLMNTPTTINFATGTTSLTIGGTGTTQINIGSQTNVTAIYALASVYLGSAGHPNVILENSNSGTAAIFTSSLTTSLTLGYVSAPVYITSSSVTLTTPKVNVTAGSNKSVDSGVLVNGICTISNTSVTASSKIFITRKGYNASTVLGELQISAIVASTSFTVTSRQPTIASGVETNDQSSFDYILIN